MRKTAPAIALALIATPASAQLYNPYVQPDLMEQQRRDIANGRYGTTYEQQQRQLGNEQPRQRQGYGERTVTVPYGSDVYIVRPRGKLF